MFTLILIGLVLFINTISGTYNEAHHAFTSHVQIKEQSLSQEELYQAYANAIAELVPSNKPLVILVPLNGSPDNEYHASIRNAQIGLDVLKRTPHQQKYLLLSEGITGSTCVPGSTITAYLINLVEGYNPQNDITVLLEKNARTTVDNVLFSKQLLLDTFPHEDVYIIIAGFSDSRDMLRIDIGHAARAFMLARHNWRDNTKLHVVGIIPTTKIDSTLQGYPLSYNLSTMILGVTGVLYLPVFDKSHLSFNCQ